MLHDLQAAMRRQLLADAPEAPAGILGDGIPASMRFAVHANNVVGSLVEALEAAFPVTARLLGRTAFRRAAASYVRRHPPLVPQLLAFGDGFPDHLDAMPEAADLARLEWAWNGAFFAADAPMLDPEDLRVVPQHRYPELRFALHPSAHLLTMACPVLDLWDALRRDEPPPRPTSDGGQVLIVRPLTEVHAVAIGRGEFTLLLALSAGVNLGHAAAAATGTDPGLDLQATLLAHLQLGTFTTFSLLPEE
ncbi:DNA-binding domain-containing protein [Azospirillum sp. TSO22-1]|uniref:HvfC/BufC N-terminal domain-containing protein n=1 Tax=Azospirillum sp. TSO22-1 TaxID=716789 RepID=UPI000D654318|nr:DNA-binding domain-containing protein [Azospirillum sp. TSO22-1]